MEVTYYGHSSVHLATNNQGIVIDPWLSGNPDCPINVDDVRDVSTIFVTHGAYDHIGDAPTLATRHDAPIICDAATHIALLQQGFPEELLESYIWGMHVDRDGWSVRIVESHHQSAWYDEGVVGPAMGYILTLDDRVIYHMGDTSISRDYELFGDLYDPEICFIPIGGTAGSYPELYPNEAALVAEWLEPETIIPVHYSDPNHPDAFKRHCEDRGVTADIIRMEPGESRTL